MTTDSATLGTLPCGLATISAEGWLSPTALVAMTLTVYSVPPVKPVTVALPARAFTLSAGFSDTAAASVQLSPASFHRTL